jgi:hypothetical protein
MKKPTPAQRRLLEELRDKTFRRLTSMQSYRNCVANGWINLGKIEITPAGLEALK